MRPNTSLLPSRVLRVAPLLAACLLASGLAVGCQTSGGTPAEATGVAQQAIQGGTIDATNKFTVGVCASNRQTFGNCAGICTGTLILPNLVVTARHCVEDSTEFAVNGGEPGIDCARSRFTGRSHPYFHVTTNTTMASSAEGWFRTKDVIVTPGTDFCGNDLAFLVLDGAGVPASIAKPVAPGARYAMTDAAHYGLAMAAIGYGITSPSANDSGTRRVRQPVSILCTPGDTRRDCGDLRTGQLAGVITAKEFVAGDGPCKGDSGSGAFEHFNYTFGTFVSFGVLSRGGESEDGRTCSLSIYTRLDSWRDLVVQAAAQASNNWTLYPKPSPDWTVYTPPSPPGTGDAGPKPTEPAGAGEACTDDAGCVSGRCLDAGDGTLVCAAPCAEDGSCAEGLVCDGNACVSPAGEGEGEGAGGTASRGPNTAAAPREAPTAEVPVGCAAAPDPTKPVPWRALGLSAAVVLGAGARRRRRASATT